MQHQSRMLKRSKPTTMDNTTPAGLVKKLAPADPAKANIRIPNVVTENASPGYG